MVVHGDTFGGACILKTLLYSLFAGTFFSVLFSGDISTDAVRLMVAHASAYKKYIKKIEQDLKLLRAAQFIPFGEWVAKKIAQTRGYSEREIQQAKILNRFVAAGRNKKAAIHKIINGYGAEVIERVFSKLKERFGALKKTPEVRAMLIDLLHQEMMHALGIEGTKDWFCIEIERKHNKKHYVITGEAFDVYLHQTAITLFAMYWWEVCLEQ